MIDKRDSTGRFEGQDRRSCPKCGHTMVYGELSHSANFGVTKDPHFVTSYGFMQVRYDRATPVDCFMCMSCGFVELYGRTPMSVLDPIERQKLIKDEFPELKEHLEKTKDKIDKADQMSRLDSYDDDDNDKGRGGKGGAGRGGKYGRGKGGGGDDDGPKHIGI